MRENKHTLRFCFHLWERWDQNCWQVAGCCLFFVFIWSDTFVNCFNCRVSKCVKQFRRRHWTYPLDKIKSTIDPTPLRQKSPQLNRLIGQKCWQSYSSHRQNVRHWTKQEVMQAVNLPISRHRYQHKFNPSLSEPFGSATDTVIQHLGRGRYMSY